MIIVCILRWLFGYMEFSVKGKFPERFLNLAARKGINLWNLKSSGDNGFSARTKLPDYYILENIAEKTQTSIHIDRKYGLPVLIEKYKYRSGIFIGGILFFVICQYLSGFIWNIEIDVPNTINEYEIRKELTDLGLYQGTRSENIDIHEIERTMTINNPKISWITVNIMGTKANVKISPNLSMDIDKNEDVVSNIKATNDGVITRMEVKNGTAMVKVGEAVTANQLLVSGVIEYSDGSSILVDSNAQVYAQTSKRADIEIPLNLQIPKKEEGFINKYDMDILGVRLPLTLSPNPDNTYIKSTTKNIVDFFGKQIPITLYSESWYKYSNNTTSLTVEKAKKIAENRLKLYEVFMLYSLNKGRFLQKNYKIKESPDKIILSGEYIIEEDICSKSIIMTKSNDQPHEP